jgi:membrane protease subunit HflK
MVLSAESYSSKILPDARGEAKEIIESARAQAFEIESLAKSRQYRFEQILPIYAESPQMVRQTLRVQTWQQLSSVTVHQLSDGEDLVLTHPTETTP